MLCGANISEVVYVGRAVRMGFRSGGGSTGSAITCSRTIFVSLVMKGFASTHFCSIVHIACLTWAQALHILAND